MKFTGKRKHDSESEKQSRKTENEPFFESDVLGSYTGIPMETLKNDILTMPTQDADDL